VDGEALEELLDPAAAGPARRHRRGLGPIMTRKIERRGIHVPREFVPMVDPVA
jgi:hypothetical protein